MEISPHFTLNNALLNKEVMVSNVSSSPSMLQFYIMHYVKLNKQMGAED